MTPATPTGILIVKCVVFLAAGIAIGFGILFAVMVFVVARMCKDLERSRREDPDREDGDDATSKRDL